MENVVQKNKKTAWIIIGALLLIGGFVWWANREYTVAEFCQKAEQKINMSLQSDDSPIKRKVENAHLTVTVRDAYVSSMRVTTKDGSNSAGDATGSNVRSMKVTITTKWDGLFHKNGTTIVDLSYERVRDKWQVTDAKITYTDAWINIEDPEFWFVVGSALVVFLI